MKLAAIERITEILPHNNAERLEVAKVLGWQTVVKKGEFEVGDRVVFVAIDTILPRTPWSEFLVDPKHPDKPIRLKTVKLRGQYSQGLVLPISVLPEDDQILIDGEDVSEILGITKYEKPIPACLRGLAIGAFPNHLATQTDEENGLSDPDLVSKVLESDWLTVTRKLDGSSITIIIEDHEIKHVCSRKLDLKEDINNAWWKVARKLDLTLTSGRYVIQGELMGPGLQGNELNLVEPTLFVFQLKHNDDLYSYTDMAHECKYVLKCNVVPHVEDIGWKVTLPELQALADSQKLPDGKPAEGIVVRPLVYTQQGIGRPLGFKLINRNYKD